MLPPRRSHRRLLYPAIYLLPTTYAVKSILFSNNSTVASVSSIGASLTILVTTPSAFSMVSALCYTMNLPLRASSLLSLKHRYVGPALLAPTTRVEDVLYGFYRWLDLHPSEALLISIKYEDGPGRVYDAEFQQKLYNVLDSDVAKRYWVQTNGVVRRPPELSMIYNANPFLSLFL